MSACLYYRATPGVYEQARAAIDAAMGYPSADTATIWTPAVAAPHDADGRCLLALWQELADLSPVAAVLDSLEEITEAEYHASLPPPDEETT